VKPEEAKAIARLLRRLIRAEADVEIYREILLDLSPTEAADLLYDRQQSVEYRAVLGEYEPWISLIEKADSETDLIEVLRQILGEKKPN
jgi:hypothetical protein